MGGVIFNASCVMSNVLSQLACLSSKGCGWYILSKDDLEVQDLELGWQRHTHLHNVRGGRKQGTPIQCRIQYTLCQVNEIHLFGAKL